MYIYIYVYNIHTHKHACLEHRCSKKAKKATSDATKAIAAAMALALDIAAVSTNYTSIFSSYKYSCCRSCCPAAGGDGVAATAVELLAIPIPQTRAKPSVRDASEALYPPSAQHGHSMGAAPQTPQTKSKLLNLLAEASVCGFGPGKDRELVKGHAGKDLGQAFRGWRVQGFRFHYVRRSEIRLADPT